MILLAPLRLFRLRRPKGICLSKFPLDSQRTPRRPRRWHIPVPAVPEARKENRCRKTTRPSLASDSFAFPAILLPRLGAPDGAPKSRARTSCAPKRASLRIPGQGRNRAPTGDHGDQPSVASCCFCWPVAALRPRKRRYPGRGLFAVESPSQRPDEPSKRRAARCGSQCPRGRAWVRLICFTPWVESGGGCGRAHPPSVAGRRNCPEQTARSAGQLDCEYMARARWIPAYAGMTRW